MIQSYNINNFNKDNLVGDYIQNGFVLIEDIISNQEKDEIKEELKKNKQRRLWMQWNRAD